EREAGTERDGIGSARELEDSLPGSQRDRLAGRLDERLRHRLHPEAGDDGLLRDRRRDGAETDAAAQRRASREPGGTGLADGTGDHEQMAVGSLVGVGLARRKKATDIALLEEIRRDALQ